MSDYVRNVEQVSGLLAHIHATVNSVAPAIDLKAILSATASIIALYLLQSMTWEAGLYSVTAILRLIQRVSLGAISAILMLSAASVFDGMDYYADSLSVLFLIPFLMMLTASAILVHRQNYGTSAPPSSRPKNWMFGSRGSIR